MSSWNFMLSWAEHEKFYNLEAKWKKPIKIQRAKEQVYGGHWDGCRKKTDHNSSPEASGSGELKTNKIFS